jgi:putative transposase
MTAAEKKRILGFRLVDAEDAASWKALLMELKGRGLTGKQAECKAIFAAPSKPEAIRRFRAWSERWRVEAERAVHCLEKDFYHLLHYYAFPPELWKKIRTTNVLERTFREYRRRTRPMQVFPNPDSAERIYYGVTDYLNRNWEERPQ